MVHRGGVGGSSVIASTFSPLPNLAQKGHLCCHHYMLQRYLQLFVRFCFCWCLALSLWGCAAPIEYVPSSSYLPSSAAMLAQEERLALPKELQAKLQELATPPCSVAENQRPNPRYVGDMGDTLWRVEMRLAFEALKWMAENEEKEPRLHALQARQMQPLPPMATVAAEAEPPQPWLERPGTQYTGGFVSGAIIGVVPFGPNLVNVPIEAKLLPKGTYWARVGRACGEIASGTAQIVMGCAGMSAGVGMSGTGGGAPAGIVVFSGSMAIAANGCVSASHGIDTLFSAGEPPDAPSEPPRSHTILLRPKKPTGQTPVAAEAPKPEAPKVATPIPEAPPPGVMTVKKNPGGTVTSTRRKAPPGEEPPEITTTITTNETGSVTTTRTKPLAVTPATGTAGGPRAGKPFTHKGKTEIDTANAARNGGTNVCENCGSNVVPAQRSQKGVRPPGNERHRDHKIPKSKGGDGDPSNGEILCRDCNLEKGDTL